MPDPNAKLMPPGELPEFMQSIPTVTAEEAMRMGEQDFQRRVRELLQTDGQTRRAPDRAEARRR